MKRRSASRPVRQWKSIFSNAKPSHRLSRRAWDHNLKAVIGHFVSDHLPRISK